MQTPEAKSLVRSIRKISPDIFNIEYTALRDLVPLASGNFGAVYGGYYKKRRVAVKQLLDVGDEQMHKYLQREIETLRNIHHPNIVEFLGVCEHHSGLYIVTEFISGGDLRKILKNPSITLTWDARILLATQICAAINHLHSEQIVHRDLKSHNILVTDDGIAKICDFGFSRKLPRKKGPRTLSLCGTDQWMAPEILMDDPYNETADVFSFAMVLTELVTRQKPTERNASDMFAFNVDEFRRQCPRDTPRALVNIIIRCANLTPSKRPALRDVLPKLEALGTKDKTIELKQIDSQDTKQHGTILFATKSYKAKDEVEITVKKGDQVVLIQTDESGWCEGTVNNQRGWFPKYVIAADEKNNDKTKKDTNVDENSLTSIENRSNANKQLMNFLHTRPAPEDLQDRNILRAGRRNSTHRAEADELTKKRKIETLSKFFRKKISKRNEIETQQVEESTLDKILVSMYTSLPISTHKKKYEAYEKCFPGSTLVEWLVEHSYFTENSSARTFSLYLLHSRVIVPVDSAAIEFKEKRFYRLKNHQEPVDLHVINNIKSWKGPAGTPIDVLANLMKLYQNFSENPSHKVAVEVDIAISELQHVSLATLTDITDRTVFFVNLYNLMTEYILGRFGEPENEFMAKEIQSKKAFLVDTSVFTLEFIKRSILFGIDSICDPRNAFKVDVDRYVLCLLANSSQQSPPFECYVPGSFAEVSVVVLRQFFETEFISSIHMISCPVGVQEFASLFCGDSLEEALEELKDLLPTAVNDRMQEAKQENVSPMNSGGVLYFKTD